MANSKPIAIVGAGLMGHGIAQIFATRGHPVSLLDVNRDVLAKALESIRANLTLMTQRGIGSAEDIEPAIERIRVTQDLEEAASGAEFVIEAVSEKLELKQRVFQSLDAVCPSDTVLATNTSVISITEIARKAQNKERILGTHFWNPPYLIPLVELIPGKHTSPGQWILPLTCSRAWASTRFESRRMCPGSWATGSSMLSGARPSRSWRTILPMRPR